MILVYDTETTGLPLFRQPSDHRDQPHLVEIAGLLYDDDKLVDAFEAIIRPDGWFSGPEALAAHGITHERAMDEGIAEADALAGILALQARALLRVAHNESFDQRIVRIAIKRYRDETTAREWEAAPTFCTCNAATPLCQLPPTPKMIAARLGKRFKNPNLAEALHHFTGETHVDAHRARSDAEACARIYFAMHAKAAA